MGISFAVVRGAAQTGGGNQDFTVSGFGTPKGAIFIGSGGSSDGVAAAHAIMSFGCTDGTTELVTSYTCENAAAVSNTYRTGASDEVIQFGDNAGGIDGEANFNTWITDGVRVTWGNAPGTAFLVTVILIGGSDLSVDVGTAAIPSTVDDTVDVGCGFEPDQVLFFGNGAGFSGDGYTVAQMWLGMADNGASIEQACGVFTSDDATAKGPSSGRIDTRYAVINHQSANANISRAAELTAFNAGPAPAAGFTLTNRGPNAFSNTTGYMALYYNGAVSHSIEQIDTPGSTGNDAQTGAGFTPQFVMQIMGMWVSYNIGYLSADAGAFGVSAFTADDEYSISTADEYDSANMDTQSVADDQAVNLDQDDGTDGFEAAFVSMDANGWTNNFSIVDSTTRKWIALVVEEEAAVGGQVADFSLDTILTIADGAMAGALGLVTLPTITTITDGATSAAVADITLPVIAGITPAATAQTAANLTLDAITLISNAATSAANAAINLEVITATDMSAQAAAEAALSILQALGIDTSAVAGASGNMSLNAILELAISTGQDVAVSFSLNAIPGYSNAAVAGASGTLSLNVVPAFTDSGMAAVLADLSLDTILTIVTSTGQDASVTFSLNIIPAMSQSATAAMVASLALDAVVTVDTIAAAASVAGFTIGSVYSIGINATMVEVVTPDGRIYVIMEEDRVYSIAADSRVLSIGSENRVYSIPEE